MKFTYQKQQTKPGIRLGIFGFTWQEKVGKNMLSILKDTVYEDSIKKFWGGSGINTSMVNDLHDSYVALLSTGKAPAKYIGSVPVGDTEILSETISDSTNVAKTIVDAFLYSLYNLSSIGTISYSIYDPIGYKEVAETVEESEPSSGIESVVKDTGDIISKIIIVAGLAAGTILFVNVSKLFKE